MALFPSTVINFHAVYDEKWMDSIFSLLKRIYQIVPVSALEAHYYEGRKLRHACHITFDDGDESFYHTVFPLLVKHQMSVSIYVSPKAAKERTNFWFQEIRDYDRQKMLSVINDRLSLPRPISDIT